MKYYGKKFEGKIPKSGLSVKHTMKNMKKLIVFFLIALNTHHLHAQDEEIATPSRTVAKIQPQQFVDNTFFLSLEKFNKDFGKSFNFGLGLTSTNNEVSQSGYKAEIQYRYYPLKFAESKGRKSGQSYHGGIYAGIYLHHSYNQKTTSYYEFNDIPDSDPVLVENKHKVVAFNPGIVIGYQKTFFEKLYIEAYVGGGIRTGSISDSRTGYIEYNDGIFDEDYQGVFPKIGFNIGLGL